MIPKALGSYWAKLALALVSIGGLIPCAAAEPRWVRLSFVGDTATTMGVAWNTLDGPAEVRVEYGVDDGAAGGGEGRSREERTGGYEHQAGGTTRWRGDVLGSVSEVVLTGLSPATTYRYRVGGPQGGWSDEFRFRTAPRSHPHCGRFRFAFLGDSRADEWNKERGASLKWPLLALKAAAHRPLFLIHGGDFVWRGRLVEQWPPFLAVTAPVSRILPIMYVLGNHDFGPGFGERAHFNRLMMLPRSEVALGGSGTEDFYSFELGNAVFVAISTLSFPGGKTEFQQQAEWMDRVLERSDKRWKIVYTHYPIYTRKGLYGHPPNERGQNRELVAVFNKHEVDLVLQSHNHFYERFVPSRCEDSASEEPCPTASGKGAVHITSGGGGAFPNLTPGSADAVRPVVSSAHHYVLFDIEDQELRMRAIRDDGVVIDEMRRTKEGPAQPRCDLEGSGARSADLDRAAALRGGGPTDRPAQTARLPRHEEGPATRSPQHGDVRAPEDRTLGERAVDPGCAPMVAATVGLPLGLVLLLLVLRRRKPSAK